MIKQYSSREFHSRDALWDDILKLGVRICSEAIVLSSEAKQQCQPYFED